MHANDVFDSITAPIHGARSDLPISAVFGQIATLHLKNDSLTGRGAVLAFIHRLPADIEASR